MIPDQDVCTYCEKPGQLIEIRRMKGQYHLRCVAPAKRALEAARPKSLLGSLIDRL